MGDAHHVYPLTFKLAWAQAQRSLEMFDRKIVLTGPIPENGAYNPAAGVARVEIRDDRSDIDGRCGLPLLPHNADKADALAGYGPDQTLRLSTVANRFARGIDAACQGRFRDDPAAPDGLQKVVLADNAFAVPHHISQQVEDLRFERNRRAATPEFTPADVKYMIAKHKLHARSPLGRSDKA